MAVHDNLAGRLADWARRTPLAEAAVLGGRRITYAELAADVDACARGLLGAGVRKGDRVAVLQTPHPSYLTTFLAAASIGAIWVGLNPRYRREEIAQVVADARPCALFARLRIGERAYDAEIAAIAAALEPPGLVVALDDSGSATGMAAFLERGRASSADVRAAQAACGGADPCLLVYTSGSTGRPKGALLHHRGIIGFSEAQNALWPVSPLRQLNFFPINHIGCVVDCSMPVLFAGGCCVFMEQFEPEEALRLIERERITLWGSVPSTFQMQMPLVRSGRFDLSSVRLIVWEGAAMPRELIAELREVCPNLATNYGMTETTSAIAATAPTDDLDVLADSVGCGFPGVEVRIDGPEGEAGEVQVRSDHLFAGYWRQPEATAEAFTPDGFFRTGDLAARRPDGRIRIAGRLKEMIKSGGYNVYPREVEAALEEHPSVAQAAVVRAPDPLWQEVGIAFVVSDGTVTADGLLAWLRGRLANYKVPKAILIEAALPLLPIGKVDKVALAARAARIAA